MVEASIGEGGMGSVFRGRDLELGRQVALKVLHAKLLEHPTARSRMLREAKALASIEHANVLRIHDIFEEDLLVLVLELVTGGTLSDRVRPEGMPEAEALELTGQILAGLQAVHDQELVHRDVKPANILLTEKGGVAKLADLGVAHDSQDQGMTRLGARLGTPEYMSPEQVQGHAVDARTDVYAVGIVLYELLSGDVPFAGPSEYAVADGHVKQPPDLGRISDRASANTVAAVARALAKDPDERWPTAEAMAQALAGRGDPSVLATVRIPAPARAPMPAARPEMPAPRPARPRLQVALMVGVAVTVAVVTALAFVSLQEVEVHVQQGESPVKFVEPIVAAKPAPKPRVVAVVEAPAPPEELEPIRPDPRTKDCKSSGDCRQRFPCFKKSRCRNKKCELKEKDRDPDCCSDDAYCRKMGWKKCDLAAHRCDLHGCVTDEVCGRGHRCKNGKCKRRAPIARHDGRIATYRARLSSQDHENGKGIPITWASGIVRQDRANVHRAGKKDPEDEVDGVFHTLASRSRMKTMLRISATDKELIQDGTPLIEVTVYDDWAQVVVLER